MLVLEISFGANEMAMHIWRDTTFGRTGGLIWIPGLSPVVLVAVYVCLESLGSWRYMQDVIFGGFILLLPALWGCFYISQVRTVLQEIRIDGGYLQGRCFFGRTIDFNVSEMRSVAYYPMTWKIRQINLFDRNVPGINIELESGTVFRISSRIDGFRELVSELKAASKLSNKTECSL